MSEKMIGIRNAQVMERERAIATAEVANRVGGIAVNIVRNEGEQWTPSQIGGNLNNLNNRNAPRTVPEGKVMVETTGQFPQAGMGEFHQAVDAQVAEIQQQVEQTPDQNKAA